MPPPPPTQTLLTGLIGLPPVNGVLPQAPMHTRALASLKRAPGGQGKGAARLEAGALLVVPLGGHAFEYLWTTWSACLAALHPRPLIIPCLALL